LHDAGCQRDKAANRTLHFDEYGALILLALFNPLVRSLRSLSQTSDLDKVREQLGIPHASLGSLSEAAHVFDPDVLVPIIAELAGELRPVATDPRWKDVRAILMLCWYFLGWASENEVLAHLEKRRKKATA
jgi:hypothetical protein